MWHTVAIGRLLQMWLMSNQASKSVQENEISFLEGLLLMPHINKLTLSRAHTRLEEACCIWLPFTIVPLFIHWINASYIQLLSIGLFVFCNQLVCLLFHPHAYLDQTFNSTMTLSPLKTWLFFAKFTPPPSHFFPLSVGVKLVISIFFFVFSPQNVEVFYWCGEKQWGQGRALWWQKCIFNACEWMAPHIPQQQALHWMAALTRLFSLLITALCLLTMDIVIYLHQLRGGHYKDSAIAEFFWKYHWVRYGAA